MSDEALTRRSFLETNVLLPAGAGLGAVAGIASAAAPDTSIIPTRLGPGEKLHIGIIGCGNRSKTHIRAINHYGDQFDLVALCDILPEMLEEKRRLVTSGQPKLYRDFHQMLKDPELDAVVISLPNLLHREGAVAALDAGKHVLCEKPLTIDVADTRKIIAAADRNRKVIQVGTQSRHSPGYQTTVGRRRSAPTGARSTPTRKSTRGATGACIRLKVGPSSMSREFTRSMFSTGSSTAASRKSPAWAAPTTGVWKSAIPGTMPASLSVTPTAR